MRLTVYDRIDHIDRQMGKCSERSVIFIHRDKRYLDQGALCAPRSELYRAYEGWNLRSIRSARTHICAGHARTRTRIGTFTLPVKAR